MAITQRPPSASGRTAFTLSRRRAATYSCKAILSRRLEPVARGHRGTAIQSQSSSFQAAVIRAFTAYR